MSRAQHQLVPPPKKKRGAARGWGLKQTSIGAPLPKKKQGGASWWGLMQNVNWWPPKRMRRCRGRVLCIRCFGSPRKRTLRCQWVGCGRNIHPWPRKDRCLGVGYGRKIHRWPQKKRTMRCQRGRGSCRTIGGPPPKKKKRSAATGWVSSEHYSMAGPGGGATAPMQGLGAGDGAQAGPLGGLTAPRQGLGAG